MDSLDSNQESYELNDSFPKADLTCCLYQGSGREKRSRGTETEPCYLLPPGAAFWPKFEGVTADRATDTAMETNEV